MFSEKHIADQFGAESGDAVEDSSSCSSCSVRYLPLRWNGCLYDSVMTMWQQIDIYNSWHPVANKQCENHIPALLMWCFFLMHVSHKSLSKSYLSIMYFILQFMVFSHIELNMFISFSRTEGFDRIFSEPAQSKFTSTLLQCLRDRNVSLQLGQNENTLEMFVVII